MATQSQTPQFILDQLVTTMNHHDLEGFLECFDIDIKLSNRLTLIASLAVKDYASPREARIQLGEYLAFYNTQRPHQALAYQTPAAIYQKKGEESTNKNAIFVS
jgi:transposase InsO family protein